MTNLTPTIVTVPATSSATGVGGPVQPWGHPLVLHVVRPIVVIGIRAARVFLQTVLGILTGTTVLPAVAPQFDIVPAAEFGDRLILAAGLSVAAVAVNVIWNLLELVTKLDQKYPTLTV